MVASRLCWKRDGTAARSATSHAVSDSGVWAIRAARIWASCRCSMGMRASPRAVDEQVQHRPARAPAAGLTGEAVAITLVASPPPASAPAGWRSAAACAGAAGTPGARTAPAGPRPGRRPRSGRSAPGRRRAGAGAFSPSAGEVASSSAAQEAASTGAELLVLPGQLGDEVPQAAHRAPLAVEPGHRSSIARISPGAPLGDHQHRRPKPAARPGPARVFATLPLAEHDVQHHALPGLVVAPRPPAPPPWPRSAGSAGKSRHRAAPAAPPRPGSEHGRRDSAPGAVGSSGWQCSWREVALRQAPHRPMINASSGRVRTAVRPFGSPSLTKLLAPSRICDTRISSSPSAVCTRLGRFPFREPRARDVRSYRPRPRKASTSSSIAFGRVSRAPSRPIPAAWRPTRTPSPSSLSMAVPSSTLGATLLLTA
jgi:hypothetical protein